MIINDENIISITEANRNFTKIAKKAKNTKEPIIVMKNNKPDLVIMDYETFKQTQKVLTKSAATKLANEIMDEYSDVFKELAK